MPDPRQLLRQNTPTPRPRLVSGTVAAGPTLPASPQDPVYVTLTNHSLDLAIPMVWAPLWGQSTPQAGASVLVVYDDNGVPYAAWWEGTTPVESATAVVLTSAGMIVTGGLDVARAAPAGNVTGCILQPGTSAGQRVTVINESSRTITFATAGTSNVADGTSDVIAALTARTFTWDASTSLWYRTA